MPSNVLCLFFFFAAALVQRPALDFDFVIESLKTQGQWESTGGDHYAFRPSAPNPKWRPYREGRWLYTDYGWTWEGKEDGSWATDHYGYWTKKQMAGWVWIPEGLWLPAAVEWLKSGNYVGWRPSKLDRFSNLLESDAERHGDPSEWNFVLMEKVKGSLNPDDYVDDATAETLLKNAVPVDHVYVSYREIERPGPSAEILKNAKGDMPPVPVVTDLQDRAAKTGKADPETYYLFRPTFNQDNDGLMRRVHLFLNPRAKVENDKSIKDTVGDRRTDADKKKETKKVEEQLKKEREHMESLYR